MEKIKIYKSGVVSILRHSIPSIVLEKIENCWIIRVSMPFKLISFTLLKKS